MKYAILAVCCLVALAAAQSPPPFGTVIEQWNLPMSGGYSGSGITWNQSMGRFYLVDQGASGWDWVRELEPADPVGTMVLSPWVCEPIGGASLQIPWGLAWDPDSNCFWMSAALDGQTIGGAYLLKYIWLGDRWVWGGAPGDSWKVGDGGNGGALQCLWIAGMEKSLRNGRFYAIPVHSSPSDSNYPVCFDPYLKVSYGRLANGDHTSERGLTLVPYDSNYILTCGWNMNTYCKRDSTGLLLDSVHATVNGPADWSLHIPEDIRPDDTVCAYCICSNSSNTLKRISLGMVWSQLVGVGVEDIPEVRFDTAPDATIVRGTLFLPSRERGTLLDITGRCVMDLMPGENDVRRLSPGIYFIRQKSESSVVRKVIIQR